MNIKTEDMATLVKNIYNDCLTSLEDPNGVCVNGVVHKSYLSITKVVEHEEEITSLLDMLDANLKAGSAADGSSFMLMVNTSEDEQWCEQVTAEMLLMLGLASRHIIFLFPRGAWGILPGSMPYVQIDTSGKYEDSLYKNVLEYREADAS